MKGSRFRLLLCGAAALAASLAACSGASPHHASPSPSAPTSVVTPLVGSLREVVTALATPEPVLAQAEARLTATCMRRSGFAYPVDTRGVVQRASRRSGRIWCGARQDAATGHATDDPAQHVHSDLVRAKPASIHDGARGSHLGIRVRHRS